MTVIDKLSWNNQLSDETIKQVKQCILLSKQKKEKMSSEELKP